MNVGRMDCLRWSHRLVDAAIRNCADPVIRINADAPGASIAYRADRASACTAGEAAMRVQDLYSPGAKITHADQALADAASTMLESRVGFLIVVEGLGMGRKPVGVLTDRDIVRGQLRLSADLFCLTVGDVMTADPLTLPASSGVTEAIDALRERGVRRAPVVDGSGNLLGVVTLDDLLPAVARELEELATLVGTQARHERAQVA